MRRFGWVLLLLGLSGAQDYRPATVAEVVLGRVSPGRVWVSGRYLAFFPAQRAVAGVVAGARFALVLEGEAFDRSPEAGRYLEVWGELVQGGGGFRLRFHNFRYPGEDRAPRPARLAEGVSRVWLRVYPPGGVGEPPVGVSEDRRVFRLPGYAGPFGVVCLEVRPLGPGVLADARLCGDG